MINIFLKVLMIVPRRAFSRHSCRGPRGRDQIPAASAYLKRSFIIF